MFPKKHIFFLLKTLFVMFLPLWLLKSNSFGSVIVQSFIVAMVVGYMFSFYCLSHALRTMPIGIAYAIWSALGIVLITLIGIFVFKQVPDLPAYIGIALIMAGVIIINLFSKMEVH